MPSDFDDNTLARLAAARAAINDAQANADAYARSELDPASALLSALHDALNSMGGVPEPNAYATAAEWREAEDQHTFATRRYGNEIRDAQQALDAVRFEHTRLLDVIPALRREHLKAVVSAMDRAIVERVADTARLATVRQSLLNRLPREEWHALIDPRDPAGPQYKVALQGYPDMSLFQASAPGDGIGPDKSAALVAELGIL